jgi:23S rRNA-/tRNA-specific pseudouridylate synthase
VLANKRAVCSAGSGQPALTRWRVRERWGGRTLLEAEPVTGRMHQLRVHLAAIGHPILGDALYRLDEGCDDLFLRRLRGLTEDDATELLGHHRLALHALRLELEHPVLGRRLELHAPLWPDLEALGMPGDAGR